jgi:hypothetical protein
MWKRKVASQTKKAFEWYLIGVYIVHFSKKTFFVKKRKEKPTICSQSQSSQMGKIARK